MTTNHVNLQLELKVTDKLLWDLCGCAREKSQNENFWADEVCQWGIILFLCWLLMHHTEMGLCKNRAGPLWSKICPCASWEEHWGWESAFVCSTERWGRLLLMCPLGMADSAVCRCKGLPISHGNMFANDCCLWRCPFNLKVTSWLTLSLVPTSPHHYWDTHPDRTRLGAAFCYLNGSSMAIAHWAQCHVPCLEAAETEAASLSLEPSSGASLSYWL